MKRFAYLFIFIFIFSCSTKPKKKYEYDVSVSINPIKLIVKTISPKLKVKALLKGAVSPHDYAPLPSDIIDISKSNLFIYTGTSVDKWAVELIKKNDLKVKKKSLNSLFSEKDIKKNPHIWIGIENSLKMAKVISLSFAEIYPEKRDYYLIAFDTYKKRAQKFNDEWKKKIDALKEKRVWEYHPAWNYLFKEVGIDIAGTITVNPHKMFSAKELKKIIDEIKKEHIKVIVSEIQHKPKILDAIKKQTGVKIVYLDVLGNDRDKDYFSFLNNNLNKVYEALKE